MKESIKIFEESPDVSGIIVTYHPGLEFENHVVNCVQPQVKSLVIIDNSNDIAVTR